MKSRATSAPESIGVLICSYRRPAILSRGLDALATQRRSPDDVIVVARADDHDTRETLAARRPSGGLTPRVVLVSRPGMVHALNAGLDAARTDLLAITDDDTVPHADWLARILGHFRSDPCLGGLGGRDWCHDGLGFDDRVAARVGHMRWYGHAIGNHHLGAGPPRTVDFLKGANMSYRLEALAGGLRFDTRLRGSGAQPMNDMAFSCAVRRAGWRLCYDPLVAVDHYAARRDEPRHYAGVTALADHAGLFDCAYNEMLARSHALTPAGCAAYRAWSFLIGTGVSPGMVQALRYTPRLRAASWRRFWTMQQGKSAAARAMRQTGVTGLVASPTHAARDLA